MKIPLELVGEHLTVNATIRAPRYRIAVLSTIKFVVDTGSNVSMIGYGDITRLNIPQILPHKDYSDIGGTKLNLRILKAITLSFLEDETDKLQQFQLSEFNAAFPSKTDQSSRDRAKEIPSILGIDFLISQKLALYCNPSAGQFYFEKA